MDLGKVRVEDTGRGFERRWGHEKRNRYDGKTAHMSLYSLVRNARARGRLRGGFMVARGSFV